MGESVAPGRILPPGRHSLGAFGHADRCTRPIRAQTRHDFSRRKLTWQMLRPSQKGKGSAALFFQPEQNGARAKSARVQAHFRPQCLEPGLLIPVPIGLSPIREQTRASALQRWPIRNSTSHRATTAAINSDTAEVCCLRGSLMLRSFSCLKP